MTQMDADELTTAGEDHCAALESVMLKGTVGETYCVGGDNEQANMALVDLLCDLVDQHLDGPQGASRALKTFVQDRAGHDRRFTIDSTQFHTKFGRQVRTAYPQGLG